MARPRGTYTTLENWALDLAPSLPGVAGWVLLELCRQANYNRKTLTAGQLLDKLPFEIRAIQNALKYLIAQGYAHQETPTTYAARTSAVPALCTDMRIQEGVNAQQDDKTPVLNSAIQLHNQKESEGIQKEEKKTTARQNTARLKVTPAKPKVQKTEDHGTPFQELFAAIATTCYGGHEGLTNEARARIGKATKSLTGAGYAAADIAQIATWIHANESWRRGPLAPQTLAERAPAWRQGLTTSTNGRMPKANELDDQDWAAEAAEADRRNRFLNEDTLTSASGWVN